MKYAVTYMGVVTGSFAGRDDGYPQQKTALLEKDADLIRFANLPELQVYTLTPVPINTINFLIEKEKTKLQEKKKQVDKEKQIALSKLNSTEKKLLGL